MKPILGKCERDVRRDDIHLARLNRQALVDLSDRHRGFLRQEPIGASAGGLEAVSVLLATLPPKSDMAYVVIQHLDPEHKSLLAESTMGKVMAEARTRSHERCRWPTVPTGR